jgi:hypothetical protein
MAARFDTSTGALQRHKPHVAATVEKAHARRETSIGESVLAKLDKLEHQLQVLYEDSIGLLERAKTAQDTTAGVRAIHAVRTVLSESRSQLELLAEIRGDISRQPQVDIAVLAPMILQCFQEGGVSVEVRTAVARKLTEMDGTLELPPAG